MLAEPRIHASRPQPDKVTIALKPLTDQPWEKVIDALPVLKRLG